MSNHPIVLPPKYYLHYYQYILHIVQKHYGDILTKDETAFTKTFETLTEDSQCVYLRMAGRRSLFFRASQLQYEEIKDTDKALKQLVKANFVEILQAQHAPFVEELLKIYTKQELYQATQFFECKDIKKSQKKVDFILHLSQLPFEKIAQYFNQQATVFVQSQVEMEQKIRYLFFGNLYGNTTDFVVRDVGHRTFEMKDDADFSPYFQSRQEIEECYTLSLLSQKLYLLEDQNQGKDTFEWWNQWSVSLKVETEKALFKWDKIHLRLGKHFEKNKQDEWAKEAYQKTLKPPSRERQARIYKRQKNNEKAIEICWTILENPQNVKEQIFAQDFINRLTKGDKSLHRQKLQQAEILQLSKDWQYSVEQGVLQHFQKKGYNGIFSENHLWRGLFGVVFWDLLYDTKSAALHHPLQRLPSDLYKSQFYKNRKEAIHQRLNVLQDKSIFSTQLQRIFQEKKDIQNPLIIWDENLQTAILELYQKLKLPQLQAILLKMCENFKDHSSGFPDLFIWKKRAYHLIEVKSPTDTLSAQQLWWLDFFKSLNVKAKVLRVEWKIKSK